MVSIAYLTSRKASDSADSFVAHRSAKWYMVAFSLIGVALSGVTCISVSGAVGISNFSYFQFVLSFDTWNVPFIVTVALCLFLIWLYTNKRDLKKTIVITNLLRAKGLL
ncbi:hypothetical protein L950_0213905 [Sphingobacterium sp. IITKGP-BTPF85]|nr:hypothetical protein L950_0213905 [Sphingobacterium sp. IITKGP-BTPF85]